MKERRVKLWAPTWKEVEGAAANIGRRNLWRVRPLYEMEDLMSEAHLVFLRLVRRYPRVVDPPHFMALFLSSWSRVLHSMAARRSRDASGHVAVGGFQQGSPDDGPGEDGGGFNFRTIGDRAPMPHHDLRFWKRLEAACGESPALTALVKNLDQPGRPRRCSRNANGTRMTTNGFLCRIARMDPGVVDLRAELFDFLSAATAAASV